jgi:tRNA(fMet)-specific endonuclease VapC
MTHLLDTNACIAIMRGHEHVCRRMQSFTPSDLGISTITLFELLAGVERCQQPERERIKVFRFVEPLHLIPFDADAAAETARIRWHLERQGNVIGPYDLQLAGQALVIDVTLVTHNTKEFQRVPGLRLTDWQQD